MVTKYGTSGNNVLTGSNYKDYLYGYGGNDSLYGYGGNDVLSGGTGNDYLNGGTGSDTMYGGLGNDNFIVDNSHDSVVEYSYQGVDRVYSHLYSYTLPYYVENLTLSGNAIKGYGNDNAYGNSIVGNSKNNYLYGKAGNDSLYGNGGNDYLDGGTGKDTMYGGLGNDSFVVDNSYDSVVEYSYQGVDRVYSHLYSYTLPYYVENLTLSGNATKGYGNDNAYGNSIVGNSKNNYLYGKAGNDSLYGNSGNDYLDGGTGNDYLSGGSGKDTLVGGSGDDVLVGGSGQDTMKDGTGKDRFKYYSTSESLVGYSQRDIIPDFDRGYDRIDLSSIDANKNISGNQAFKFIGTKGFTGTAGEVRYFRSGSATIVQVDIQGDGNRSAEMEIQLNNTSYITASDFVL